MEDRLDIQTSIDELLDMACCRLSVSEFKILLIRVSEILENYKADYTFDDE